MGLVATSKLRKCRKELAANNEYAQVTKSNLEALASMVDEDIDVPYFKRNNSTVDLYIVISSDTGLCAGYNNNVVSYLNNMKKDIENDIEVIAVGSRGISYLNKSNFNIIAEYVDIPDVPSSKDVKVVYEKAIDLFVNKKVASVNVVYTEFQSPVKQVVKSEQILPINKIKGDASNQIVEPDINTVLKDSLDIYLKGKLRSILLSSKCSEQSSRMSAMDSATNNANDILADLNLKFNRIRQTMITQEISEIVGGAEAQK